MIAQNAGASSSFQEVTDLLFQASDVALCTHVNPDPDAYGSMCGLHLALEQKLGPNATIKSFNVSGADPQHIFLPGVSRVEVMPEPSWKPDVIIFCDCGDMTRVGKELCVWANEQGCPIVNLDHHSSNDSYGSFNIIDAALSSTSELIYQMLATTDVQLTPEISKCLLAGIIGDTGGFRYRSNTADTMRVAAHLMDSGASLPELTAILYGSVPLSTVQLESYAFQNLQISKNGKLAGIVITPEDYTRLGVESEAGEMLAEKIRDISGVVISYSIRWMDNGWKVSLRTCSDEVDLTRVAKIFGGGGHRAAAAFRFSDPIEEVLPRIQEGLAALL